MSERIVGVSLAGKTFYWNVNESRSGSHYLTIIAKKGPGDEEKMVLFDSQIPSFIHKTLEAYGEICRLNGVPLLMGPAQSGLEPQVREPGGKKGNHWEMGHVEPDLPEGPHPKCPTCGAHTVKEDEVQYGRDGFQCIIVQYVPSANDLLRVRCSKCGWTPESKRTAKVANEVFALYEWGQPGYDQWAPYTR